MTIDSFVSQVGRAVGLADDRAGNAGARRRAAGTGAVPAATDSAAAAAQVAPAATATTTATPGTPTAPTPPPPPYSLPWQLRPVAAANVIRSDTAFAFYDNGMGASGSTVASMLLASYKLTPTLAPLVRLGVVAEQRARRWARTALVRQPDRRRSRTRSGSTASAGRRSLGATIPIGSGGGNMPDAGAATANAAGIRARSAMDNAMFAVNYFTAIAGGGVAYVDHKLTVQLEATLLQLFRVRGDMAAVQRPIRRAPTRRSACTPATSSSRCCRSAASCATSAG